VEQHHWKSEIFLKPNDFKLAGETELRSDGYTVVATEKAALGVDRPTTARFLLRAEIKDLKYNSYGSLAGSFSEAEMMVDWQLLDSANQEVLFTSATRGYGKWRDESPVDAIRWAFRATLGRFLRKDWISKALTLPKAKKEEVTTEALSPRSIHIKPCKRKKAYRLPQDMEEVMHGAVLLHTGATLGSGFIVSEDGYIFTAAHVVSGVKEIVVRLKSDLELNAQVLRVDEAQDMALLKIVGKGHRCLSLVLDALAAIGSEIYAIGTPLDEKLAFSVSKGIVSGYREFNGVKYIQTDATLNPGNSGGPLLDEEGMVVGMATWKIVRQGIEGLFFGVPLAVGSHSLGIKWVE